MRFVDVLRRLLVGLLAVPIGVVLVDAVLRALEVDQNNPVVRRVGEGARLVTPDPATRLVADQSYWQTVFVVVVGYAALALVVAAVLGALQGVLGALSRRRARR